MASFPLAPTSWSSVVVYEIGADRFEQAFTAFELDDAHLDELARSLGCEVDEVLDENGKWVRIRSGSSAR